MNLIPIAYAQSASSTAETIEAIYEGAAQNFNASYEFWYFILAAAITILALAVILASVKGLFKSLLKGRLR